MDDVGGAGRSGRFTRRDALKVGAVAAGAAWIAPVVASFDTPAAAASCEGLAFCAAANCKTYSNRFSVRGQSNASFADACAKATAAWIAQCSNNCAAATNCPDHQDCVSNVGALPDPIQGEKVNGVYNCSQSGTCKCACAA